MKFGETSNSIDILISIIGELQTRESKTVFGNQLIGLRNLCEILNNDFNKNISRFTAAQEEKLDSELEYLFIKLKELEDVVNERI